ncbi:hypothetical protein VTL71DRAFT_5639 [Oculimacula yallundae]|uniref:Uncharacterized protein n=1 Tax=Oculimacula yallundae TaxID=86028 RepID=A0ABR4BZ13_9HELO
MFLPRLPGGIRALGV